MRTRFASLAAVPLLAFAAGSARADDPAPAAAPAAAPSPAAAAAPSAAPSAASDRAHIDAAVAFLKALTHTSRKGDQGAQAWADLKDVSADKVSITIAGAHHDLDVAGKSGDAKLTTFSKIATLRDGKDIKGVTVGLLDFKIGADEHKGAGKVEMTQADGKWTVQSIEVE